MLLVTDVFMTNTNISSEETLLSLLLIMIFDSIFYGRNFHKDRILFLASWVG